METVHVALELGKHIPYYNMNMKEAWALEVILATNLNLLRLTATGSSPEDSALQNTALR